MRIDCSLRNAPPSPGRRCVPDIVNGNLLLWAVHHGHMPTMLWMEKWQFFFTVYWCEPGKLPFQVCLRRYLHTAAVNANVGMLRFLQRWGTEQQGQEVNIDWVTMTTIACVHGHMEVLQFVKDNNVLWYPWPLIKYAAEQGQTDAMRFLKAWGSEQSWDIMQTIKESTVVFDALLTNNVAVLGLLIEWGLTRSDALSSLRYSRAHEIATGRLGLPEMAALYQILDALYFI